MLLGGLSILASQFALQGHLLVPQQNGANPYLECTSACFQGSPKHFAKYYRLSGPMMRVFFCGHCCPRFIR